MKQGPALKVAIAHDWLIGGGAEQVVLELHRLFPDAPIYTSYCTEEWRNRLDNKVVTGYLQRWPFSSLRKFLPLLRQRWFRSLDLSGFDLIISSSGNGEAKFVRPPSGAKHLCYCHTPTHFYWRHYSQYMKSPGFGLADPLVRLGLKLLVSPLKKADYRAAQKVDQFIANSTHIQGDIKKYYGRDAVVVHPPVSIERFNTLSPRERKGFVTVGRQVPYKHTDIIIEACNTLGLLLTVVGRGPDHEKLVRMGGPTITFSGDASDEEVGHALASAEAFIFASFEDFGITPVEAMAAGTPVIAYEAGGALDYVVPGKTGEFFDQQNAASLADALKNFKSNDYFAGDIKEHVEAFSKENFQKNVLAQINDLLKAG